MKSRYIENTNTDILKIILQNWILFYKINYNIKMEIINAEVGQFIGVDQFNDFYRKKIQILF